MDNALDIFNQGPFGTLFPKKDYAVKAEDTGSLTLTLVLPGFDIDDINVDLAGDSLMIEASSEERRPVSKSFKIDDSIDGKGIKASLKNGILAISLPLKKTKVRKITVTG